MTDRIAITRIERRGETYIAYFVLDEKRKLKELQVFEPEDRSILDHIYVGYVEKVVANIGAAFVRIGGGKKCYLPLDDLKCPVYVRRQSPARPLSEGDELLVQVTRDAVKTKDAIISTKLTIHGLYCFLTTGNTRLGVSKKLDKERSDALLSLAEELCADHEEKGYGLVLRTNAAEQTTDAVRDDIVKTVRQYEALCTAGVHQKTGALVCRSLPGYLLRLKSQKLSEIEKIYTDQDDLYQETCAALPQLAASGLLERYTDFSVSLSTLYGLNAALDGLLAAKVWLNSGANIIIESLETMTVIDVNSGKNLSRKPDALFAVNLEAAEEIARQLRLRNISGMILIDFINMKSEEQKRELIVRLKKALKEDHVPVNFIDITGLGLVELTRKKVYKSLREILEK